MLNKHIKKNRINTKVFSFKTVRYKNFIAYSSRLKRLKNYEKNNLIKIIKFLENYKRDLVSKKINYNFSQIKNKLLFLGARKVDYVEVLDVKTLKKPKKNRFNLFFAFYVGKIRFIDNF